MKGIKTWFLYYKYCKAAPKSYPRMICEGGGVEFEKALISVRVHSDDKKKRQNQGRASFGGYSSYIQGWTEMKKENRGVGPFQK